MQNQTQIMPSQSQRARAPYRTPKLQRYGRLASITESGSTASSIENSTFNNSTF